MIRYCSNCGAELIEGATSCPSCGTNLEVKIVQPMPAGNIPQQQTNQPPTYTPIAQSSPPPRSKNKFIFAAVVIIVIIVVAALFLIMQGTNKNDKDRFIGIWDAQMGGIGVGNSSSIGTWTFYENGSLKMDSPSSYDRPSITFERNDTFKTLTVTNISESSYSSMAQWTTYQLEGGKLKIAFANSDNQLLPLTLPMDYKFSDDNTFTLTYMMFPLTFTRTTELPTNQISAPLDWENINISFDSPDTVHWDWVNLTRSSIQYSGIHAPSEWGEITIGDVIQIGIYDEYVSGKLTWVPTNSTIGYFWFFT